MNLKRRTEEGRRAYVQGYIAALDLALTMGLPERTRDWLVGVKEGVTATLTAEPPDPPPTLSKSETTGGGESDEDTSVCRMYNAFIRSFMRPSPSWSELEAYEKDSWIEAYRFVRAESDATTLLGCKRIVEQLTAANAEVRAALCKLADVEPDTGETTLAVVGLVELDRNHARKLVDELTAANAEIVAKLAAAEGKVAELAARER